MQSRDGKQIVGQQLTNRVIVGELDRLPPNAREIVAPLKSTIGIPFASIPSSIWRYGKKIIHMLKLSSATIYYPNLPFKLHHCEVSVCYLA